MIVRTAEIDKGLEILFEEDVIAKMDLKSGESVTLKRKDSTHELPVLDKKGDALRVYLSAEIAAETGLEADKKIIVERKEGLLLLRPLEQDFMSWFNEGFDNPDIQRGCCFSSYE